MRKRSQIGFDADRWLFRRSVGALAWCRVNSPFGGVGAHRFGRC